jgi:4-carboxymuconolactone decarboxylase
VSPVSEFAADPDVPFVANALAPNRSQEEHPMTDQPERDDAYAGALDTAERMLGFRLERFLGPGPGEPPNAAEFKRIATVHAFGDAWPRTEFLDTRGRALVSVTVTACLGILEPLRGQIRIALNNGVTSQEIVEAFVQIAVYAGVARAFDSYTIAAQVFAEHAEATSER